MRNQPNNSIIQCHITLLASLLRIIEECRLRLGARGDAGGTKTRRGTECCRTQPTPAHSSFLSTKGQPLFASYLQVQSKRGSAQAFDTSL